MNPEQALPAVQKILHKVAWDSALRYPIPYEDAMSEAYVAFMAACRTFDPSRGTQFSSWVYFNAWTHLKTIVMKRSSDRLVFQEIREEEGGTEMPRQIPSLEILQELSDDARLLAAMLLETPQELLGLPMTPKQLLRKVKGLLVDRFGWTLSRTEKATTEIREALRSSWARP